MKESITDSKWSHEALLRGVPEYALPILLRTGPMEAWIVDDTAFPTSGKPSVGVARQYCGIKGKQDNCQDAVSVSVANQETSLPCAFRLYLPESWAKDAVARKKVGVPEEIRFQTKWEMALGMIEGLRKEGMAPAPVLADAGYGNASEFREGLTRLGMTYVDHQVLKDQLGLDHFEGRTWRGFHHHFSLAIAAYGFLTAEEARLFPLRSGRPSNESNLPVPEVIPGQPLPARVDRHVPSSLETLQILIAQALIVGMTRCPCCGRTGGAEAKAG